MVHRHVLLALQLAGAAALLSAAVVVMLSVRGDRELETRIAAANVHLAMLQGPPDAPHAVSNALLKRSPSPELVMDLLVDGSAEIDVALLDADWLRPPSPNPQFERIDGTAINAPGGTWRFGTTASLFDAVPLRLLSGSTRGFGERGSHGAVVSHSFARALCGDSPCVDTWFRMRSAVVPGLTHEWRVGAVVEDFLLAGGRAGVAAVAYMPIGTEPVSSLQAIWAGNAAPNLDAATAALPAGSAFVARSLEDRLRTVRQQDVELASVLAVLAGMLVLVALAGLSATVLATLQRRYRDIAIRRALGARNREALGAMFGALTVTASLAILCGAVTGPIAARVLVALPSIGGTAAAQAISAAVVLTAVLGTVLWVALRTLRRQSLRLLWTTALLVVEPAVAGSIHDFSVPIEGPASSRIVPTQAGDTEEYPTLYVVDSDFRLQALAERSIDLAAIVGRVGATPKPIHPPIVANLCHALRLPDAHAARCENTIRSAHVTYVLMSAAPPALRAPKLRPDFAPRRLRRRRKQRS